MSDADAKPCEWCGHEADDHLRRIAIPNNDYGPCRAMDEMTGGRCDCATYDPNYNADRPVTP